MIHIHYGTKTFLHISVMLVLVGVIYISPGCKLIENLHPELVKRGEEFPGSRACSECHIDIYSEWVESSHSKSYVSEKFKESTDNYEFKFCLGCHVPDIISALYGSGPLREGQEKREIAVRTYHLEEGVNCQSCHLTVDCKMAGPHSGISPHPIENKKELYKKSELCGTCHVDTYKEYLLYKDNGNNQTCQDCHMPAVNRKLIQNEPWQKLHARKEGKVHSFSMLSAMERDKDFLDIKFTEINSGSNQVTGNVEIINSKVSHSIPTGKYGYKEVVLLINLKDNLGRIIKSIQESMFLELNTHMKPGEKKIYRFVFDLEDKNNPAKELEAVLFRTNFNRTDKTLFAKVELELNLSVRLMK